MITVPAVLRDGRGAEVRTDRAWPREDGTVILEGRDVRSGQVRAGRVDAQGRSFVTPFGTDAALPGLTAAVHDGELLVHRLKRRAVVRGQGVYRKFVAGGKARAVAEAHLRAASGLAGSGLSVPDVVACRSDSITLTAVAGRSLHELGRALDDDRSPGAHDSSDAWNHWDQAWELWALRWPQFVRAPSNARSFPSARAHAAEDEVRTLDRWIRLTVSFGALGVPEDRLRSTAASVAALLLAGTSPAQLSHRDLHDKQVLVEAGTDSVGIIDCDTLAVAEPALDLANLGVHLDFRAAQGVLPPAAAALAKRHIDGAARTLLVPEERFEAYASAAALRLACVYAFRPAFAETAKSWFHEVEASLHQRTNGASYPSRRLPEPLSPRGIIRV